MSGFDIRTAFDIGRKALRAQLAGLNVTGNNISNVNTEGYSREEVVLATDIPIKSPEGIFGSGVKLEGVRRIRDQLVDRQVRTELQTKNRNETLERILSQIETTINEPSDTGLRALMSQFFDNFYGLANDPENSTTRFNLEKSAEVMVEAFHRIDKQLRTLSDDIDFEMRRQVEKVNQLTSKIGELNLQIVNVESTSQGTAGQLRDDRDKALDDLSEILDIYPFEKQNGVVDVSSPSQTLVTSNITSQLDIDVRNENGNLVSDIIDKDSNNVLTLKNGKLSALQEVRNVIIPYYRQKFDDLANELATRVNNIHLAGVGLKGSAAEVPKDNPFFTGTGAVGIDVAQAIKNNVNAIAAARRIDTKLENGEIRTSGAPGDNGIAMQIADLKQALILNNGTESLTDFFDAIISEVGIGVQSAHDKALNEDHLIEQFQNIRDSTSGVSLDEEFINLTKYQRGFQAGARLISTVDEMLQTLINM